MIRENKYLRIFGTLLHDPNLFHLNRRSASGAFAVGVFWALIPMPFQMVPAAFFSILFRVNLPLSVALVWLTNPVTMPPIFYFCYKVGTWLLGIPPQAVHFELSVNWLMTELGRIWQPFLLGCLLMAGLSSLLSYFTVRGIWRLHIVRHLQNRRRARQLRKTFKDDARP